MRHYFPSDFSTDLWWAIPERLAGTSMPLLHPERYEAQQAPLEAFPDELPMLWEQGIRAVVCLLNMPGAILAYTSAGFAFLHLPILDGAAPTLDQYREFSEFVSAQHALGQAVAVHCVAGIGRTGTMIAGHLIQNSGMSPEEAVAHIRTLRPGAVETRVQWDFLFALAANREASTGQ